MLKIVLLDQLDSVGEYMDEYMLSHIKKGQLGKFECHAKAYLMSFKWLDIYDLNAAPLRVIVYFSKENLVFLCNGEKCRERVMPLIENGAANERVLYSFFAGMIRNDTDVLEKFEEQITTTEDELLTSSRKHCAEEIITFRRRLLYLKKYYEQLNYIFEGLLENENGLISRDYLRYIRILDNRIDRLFSNVLNLRDYVTQVREAYQAQIDIEQNNLMKIFTVVTAVFLPLSLIAGWYGMNLQMPEYSWKYGYTFVVILSICIAVLSFVIFKRKKWF